MEISSRGSNRHLFLQSGGEMGEIILQYNWSTSSLGPIEQWPRSLQSTLGNILHSAFPMFLFWSDDLICFYNDAYRPSLGQNGKHPAIGKKAKEVWPEIWSNIEPMIHQAMFQGTATWKEDEQVSMYRNGKLEDAYWTYSYSPAFAEEGKICGVLVTCMETTERVLARREIESVVEVRTTELREAHKELIVANRYLQDIINLFKEPLQILEPVIKNNDIIDFRFKLTNAAYAQYANALPAELTGRPVSEVFPGYLQTTSFSNIADTFKTGEPCTFEINYNKDGLNLHNVMSATKLGDEVVVHFSDFTKLKYLQLELESKIRELERSNQYLNEFAHVTSHDLKEPTRKIKIFASRLREQLGEKLTEKDTQIFEKIEKAAKLMGQLIDDLLQYSEASQVGQNNETVNLNEIMQQLLDDLEVDIQQTKAIIHFDPLPTVCGNKRQLQQMFQNLLSNAIKYTKPGKSPNIRTTYSTVQEDARAYHLIEVIDYGIGFNEEHSEKIFKIFTRLHRKDVYSGTGIGLSIVKKVVDNHNGKIIAESKQGEGTVFKVYLPIERS